MPRKAQPPVPQDDLTTTLELFPIADLRPHPRNDGTHPPDEMAHLKASLTAHGVYRNVVIAEDGTILAGHGVVQAAHDLGHTTIAVKRMPYGPDDPRALTLLAGDNHISRLREQDDAALVALLEELARDDPLALLGTGFDVESLAALAADAHEFGHGDGSDDTEAGINYSRQIESPIYTPTGPKPELATLCDTTKTQELVAAIDAAPIADDEKAFLRLAARRHTLFQYKVIAEYYAHADAETQRLMEDSGLVIIDFGRALELGYVKLSQEIAAQYLDEYGDAE